MRKIWLVIGVVAGVFLVNHPASKEQAHGINGRKADFSGMIASEDVDTLEYWKSEVIEGRGVRDLELKLYLQDIQVIDDCPFLRKFADSGVIINLDADVWPQQTVNNSYKVYVYLTKKQRLIGSGSIKELPIESVQAIRFEQIKNSF